MKIDIVDALRASGTEMHEEAADEIERLRDELNAAKWWADKHDICWNDLIGGE